ncbi:hypothetical protein [Corynebacterium sp. H113]|uniref:hypothetical protein n=1 Tax=Corynebacterium sp. H113 TaxID=3133419 RepID=UPI00309FAF7D
MVSAAVLFQPGWVLRKREADTVDPLTGNTVGHTVTTTQGRGLIQSPLWTGFSEVTESSVTDERLVLWRPLRDIHPEVTANDEFVSPEGHVWQATTDGMWRGIPGHPPEYLAVRVCRAKEKE